MLHHCCGVCPAMHCTPRRACAYTHPPGGGRTCPATQNVIRIISQANRLRTRRRRSRHASTCLLHCRSQAFHATYPTPGTPAQAIPAQRSYSHDATRHGASTLQTEGVLAGQQAAIGCDHSQAGQARVRPAACCWLVQLPDASLRQDHVVL